MSSAFSKPIYAIALKHSMRGKSNDELCRDSTFFLNECYSPEKLSFLFKFIRSMNVFIISLKKLCY